jgi:hypothetical protein
VGDVLVHFCTSTGDALLGGNGSPGTSPYCNVGSGVDPVSTAVRAIAIRTDSPNPTRTSGFCNAAPFGCTQEGNPANRLGAVQDKTGEPQVYNPTESVTVPGTAGITARPDLVSAAIVQASGNPTNQIDYTFDQPISTGSARDFTAVLSNGQEIQGDAESVISANTVRVTFNTSGLQNFQEMAVKASAYSAYNGCTFGTNCGAVVGVNTVGGSHPINTTGGVSIGGNAGAFATGYTTGPDARSVTFNNSNGTVTIQMDQTVNPSSVGTTGWTLIANDGTVITANAQTASVVQNSAYQSQVVLTYFPTDLARAVAVQITGPPFCGTDITSSSTPAAFTFGSGSTGPDGGTLSPQGTACQVIAPTASGVAFAHLNKGKVHVRWTHLSHKQVARALRHRHHKHSR